MNWRETDQQYKEFVISILQDELNEYERLADISDECETPLHAARMRQMVVAIKNA